MQDLIARIEQLSTRSDRRWTLEGDIIRVRLRDGGRSQTVRVSQDQDRYVFRSVVLSTPAVKRTKNLRRRIAYRAWRRNGSKPLVTFAFDDEDRLVGLIEVPATTLDHEEIDLYVETLARECDRFEYVLTGADWE